MGLIFLSVPNNTSTRLYNIAFWWLSFAESSAKFSLQSSQKLMMLVGGGSEWLVFGSSVDVMADSGGGVRGEGEAKPPHDWTVLSP